MKIAYILFPMLTLAMTCALQPASAEEVKPGTIAVSATGMATVAPDMAILGLSVQREGETARQALDANNSAMANILKAMRDAGIEERDLQTSNFNIQPRYHYPKRSKTGEQPPAQITGYLVNNSLTVRIRKLDEVGTILDRSVSLGVNSGGNITFTSSKPDAVV